MSYIVCYISLSDAELSRRAAMLVGPVPVLIDAQTERDLERQSDMEIREQAAQHQALLDKNAREQRARELLIHEQIVIKENLSRIAQREQEERMHLLAMADERTREQQRVEDWKLQQRHMQQEVC